MNHASPEYSRSDPNKKSEKRLRAKANVVAQEIGDGLLAINLDSGRIYELNGTGSRLWQLVTDGLTTSEAEEILVQEYDVQPDALSAQVESVLGDLLMAGLLERVEG